MFYSYSLSIMKHCDLTTTEFIVMKQEKCHKNLLGTWGEIKS